MSGSAMHDRAKTAAAEALRLAQHDTESLDVIGAVSEAAQDAISALIDTGKRPTNSAQVLGGIALLLASFAKVVARQSGMAETDDEATACAMGIVTATALTAGHMVDDMREEQAPHAVKH